MIYLYTERIRNMESWYYEKVVYRKRSTRDDMISLLAVLVTLAICIVSFYFLGSYSFIIWLGVIYGCFRIVTSTRYDYEYIFVEDSLTIDKIINKSRRKSILAASLKDFEIFAYEDSDHIKEYIDNVQATIDVSLRNEDTMFGVIYHKSQRTLLYFDSDERIVEFLKKYASYKFKE